MCWHLQILVGRFGNHTINCGVSASYKLLLAICQCFCIFALEFSDVWVQG